MSKKHVKEEVKEQAAPAEPLVPESPVQEAPLPEVAPAPDYYEQFVRLSADFENYRKRTEREKISFLAYGKKQFAEKLLPAYEVLLRQQEKMAQEGEPEDCSAEVKNLRSGLKMVLAELGKAFTAEGIARMDVLDKPYDPATQEVVAMIPASEAQDGLVLQEVQMGFTIDGAVLRPARVIVGQHAEG